jgi:LPS sulfotransferase NodH
MKSRLPYKPFIILGTARTGSTMLWSYLNSHPDILCMRGVYGSTKKINFGKFYKELPEEYYSDKLVKYRNNKPIEFLENYVYKSYAKPYKAVGFKYFYDHDRHLLNRNELVDFFKEKSYIKFIHIKRDNLLATLFSYKRALAQNQWTKANTDFRTKISVSECNNYFLSIIENQRRFDQIFQDRILQVNYDELIQQAGETLIEIMNFLGVEKTSLRTETQKNNKIILADKIENYDELKDYFKNTNYEELFNE